MITEPPVITVPLQADENGILRAGSARAALASLITDYQNGTTPETIALRYAGLTTADVYFLIGYYLSRQTEFDEYLKAQQAPPADEHAAPAKKLTREILLARLEDETPDDESRSTGTRAQP
ncbi:MAG: hypothetical protein U0670_24250 [Anaerolineae bacterium]